MPAPLLDKPSKTASGKTIGRPRANPPKDAARTIEAHASKGFTMVGIARALGVSKDILRRWIDESPELKEALEVGRENERQELHNVLYLLATAGKNAVAAMFLLKARHGYREGDQGETANRVSINFTLPGAMKPEAYTVENEAGSTTHRIPAQGTPGA